MIVPSQHASFCKQRGKGLPLAFAHATGEYALFSAAAASTSYTTYEQWSATLGTVSNPAYRHLQPYFGLRVAVPGTYLLHAHCSGQPECMAICIELAGNVRLYDGEVQRSASGTQIEEAWAKSTDRSTVVTFGFGPNLVLQPASILLKLSVS